MLRDLEDALGSRQYNPFHLNILRAKHEYGDLPCRIQESLSLLLAAERLLPGIPENVAAARRLPATPGPAVAVEGFRANLTAQKEFVAVLRAAALAEFARFRIEQCCQVAMKLANRLDLLASLPGDQNVFAANLENYAAQTVNLAKNCDEFRTRVPETVTVLERTRAAVAAPLEIAKLEGALHDLAAVLADAPAPVSAELTA
jgi:hypothetical protein